MGVVSTVWQRYRKRKSLKGIVIDFVFLVAVLVAIITPLRRGVMTAVLRLTLIEPVAYDKILYVEDTDSLTLKTPLGRDTLLTFPPSGNVLVNIGSVWSPQTRAELPSLNKFAQKYKELIKVYFISTDDIADAQHYLLKKRYSYLHLLSAPDIEQICEDDDLEESGIWAEMVMSEPASLLIDTDGQVLIKKMGAAKWTGERIDREIKELIKND